MSRHDVHRLSDGSLVVVLQADALDTGTCVVAPLVPAEQLKQTLPRLHPIVEMEGRSYKLRVEALGAL